jgi:Protein of unknown function (DUF1565)
MEDKAMSRMKSLLVLLALAAQVPLASATVTYVVGTCKNTPYNTITSALQATPRPNVVEVCPGTYAEQVVITFPVALEGIQANNSTQAIISVPSGGLVVNATTEYGASLAAQVLVENVSGAVNLSNLTVDGTGNNVGFDYIAGVFYQNSPGTMNHLTIQNQNGNNFGVGVWLEGGSAKPSVTLENSNLQGFDSEGTNVETLTSSGPSELTATIKGNYLAPSTNAANLIEIDDGATAFVSSNLVAGGGTGFQAGIVSTGVGGSASKNIIFGTALGILVGGQGSPSVTSNTIYNGATGIRVRSATAPVTGNTIVQTGTAIDFYCTGGDNIHSNTILEAGSGLIDVATGVVSPNSFYGVGMINGGGTC